MYTDPSGATARPLGESSCAAVAVVPLAEAPRIPVPAMMPTEPGAPSAADCVRTFPSPCDSGAAPPQAARKRQSAALIESLTIVVPNSSREPVANPGYCRCSDAHNTESIREITPLRSTYVRRERFAVASLVTRAYPMPRQRHTSLTRSDTTVARDEAQQSARVRHARSFWRSKILDRAQTGLSFARSRGEP